MAIDYQAIAAAGGIGKGPSRDAAKQTRAEIWATLDEQGNRDARDRAKGRCEIVINEIRCQQPDTQTHHMMSGRGTRGKGPSCFAVHKQRACWKCHRLITDKKVRRIGSVTPYWTDHYRRMR
jgi:hypothetical protein